MTLLVSSCAQLKMSYSVHRDLNVRANNERGWDWTGSNLAQQVPPTNGFDTPGGPNGLQCAPENAPSGRQQIRSL